MTDGTDRLPIEVLERIDRTCCQFEATWKNGTPPNLLSYVNAAEGIERDTLLFELVVLDIDYRRRSGANPSLPDYLAQFPDARELVEKAFGQSRAESTSQLRLNGLQTASIIRRGNDPRNPIPERIGRYRVAEQLGEGGFGVVYRGFDDQLQRSVAIKIPHRELIQRGDDIDRFLAEARIVARLNHPRIVPVYDAGQTDDGRCFVVSKFMDGGDLSSRVGSARLTLRDAVKLVSVVADALHYAHLQGLVHRDVKPSNLLCDTDGNVSVADFGAAIQEGEGRVHGFAGTPAYMSPEQASGEGHRIDGRTDVYALGIVFYEMLTGTRPFRNANVTELLADIITCDPKPPRQINGNIPRELERICLKAIAKRAADRYPTALDLHDDLRSWSSGSQIRTRHSIVQPTPADPMAPILPKGLRPFESADSEFFLRLLPGPRDREGLTESIRFWRARIEERNAAHAFRIGLMYGPSGCGKSSLVTAGILPRLCPDILCIHMESRADTTEEQLTHVLRKTLSRDGELVTMLREIRAAHGVDGRKLLIVIDQFEQWLHANRDFQNQKLTAALRQCDGANVQCLLLVRDEFWMPVSRFMRQLEVTLVEHKNAMAVDLFDLTHARRVLTDFGRAYGRLPSELSRTQSRFLDEAVAAIASDGLVVPVRLSLFAEMMKSEPWELATLKRVGGTEGLGTLFLEKSFSTAGPTNRVHANAARAVLQTLLPEPGVNLRGHLRSGSELLRASGYAGQPNEFASLIQLLDDQLRLVTPTERDSGMPVASVDNAGEVPEISPAQSVKDQYYQLSHDFMVTPIREWLSRQKRQSLRGRASLCLAERASMWKTKSENRQLPGMLEWTRIRLLTQRKDWSDIERRMMSRASKRHVLTIAGLLIVATAFAFLGFESIGRLRAGDARTAILRADTNEVLMVLREIEPQRKWLAPLLQEAVANPNTDDNQRLNASLALLSDDPSQITFLRQRLLHADVGELRVILEAIATFADEGGQSAMVNDLWATLQDSEQDSNKRFRSACGLARLDPDSDHWDASASDVASWLVGKRIDQIPDLLQILRPVRKHLVGPLNETFLDSQRKMEQQIAAFALAALFGDANEAQRIVDLLKVAAPSQLPALVSKLESQGKDGEDLIAKELQSLLLKRSGLRSRGGPPLPNSVERRIEAADGFVTKDFFIYQALPMSELPELANLVHDHSYRPARIRPVDRAEDHVTAGVWLRDGLNWNLETDLTADQVHDRDDSYRREGMRALDVAGYKKNGQWRYVVIWIADAFATDDVRIQLTVPRSRWHDDYVKHRTDGFCPQTLQLANDEQGGHYRSQVWLRPGPRRYSEQRSSTSPDRLIPISKYRVLADASVFSYSKGFRYSAIWHYDVTFHHRTTLANNKSEFLANVVQAREMGYFPAAIDVARNLKDQSLHSTTVWNRKRMTIDTRRELGLPTCNMIISLLWLGENRLALPFLRHTFDPGFDPTLRSYLVQRIPDSNIPWITITELVNDQDIEPSTLQALLLCMGNYERSAMPRAEQLEFAKQAEAFYRDHPDSGVHAAAQWLLYRWDIEPAKLEPTVEIPTRHRTWFVNSHGQTMVRLHMAEMETEGLPEGDLEDHRFAISTHEVTIEQFRRFRENHFFDRRAAESVDCPISTVTWYDAAAYCNWLSEQEGLPQSEWCYLPNDEGNYADGMRIAPNWIRRKGYRLPHSEEWMAAASAGVDTVYCFGDDSELLPHYAWMKGNAQRGLNPVATRLPNVFGMFDVHGNLKEWCHDLTEPVDNDEVVKDRPHRFVIGGDFRHQDFQLGAEYAKHGNAAGLRELFNGIRLAKSLVTTKESAKK